MQHTVDGTAVKLSAGDCTHALGPRLGKGQAEKEIFGEFYANCVSCARRPSFSIMSSRSGIPLFYWCNTGRSTCIVFK